MVLIQGESHEDIWHGHIQNVDFINKTVDVYFYVPSLWRQIGDKIETYISWRRNFFMSSKTILRAVETSLCRRILFFESSSSTLRAVVFFVSS